MRETKKPSDVVPGASAAEGRLIYRSAARVLPETALIDIIRVSETRNRARSLSGLLLYGRDFFLQMIDGSIRELDALAHDLTRDPRHAVQWIYRLPAPSPSISTALPMGFASQSQLRAAAGSEAVALCHRVAGSDGAERLSAILSELALKLYPFSMDAGATPRQQPQPVRASEALPDPRAHVRGGTASPSLQSS